SGLNSIEPRVHPDTIVIIGPRRAMIGDGPNGMRKRIVVRRYHSAIAKGAKIFGWVKRNSGKISEPTDLLSTPSRTHGLCGIFDKEQIVRARDRFETRHVRRLTEKMDGQDRTRS